MASSSLTWPASRRRTICSSSASASSKLIAAISADPVGSLIGGSLICAPTQHNGKADVARLLYRNARIADLVAKLQQLLPTIGDRRSRRHQHANMRRCARAERGEIVPTLERRDHAAGAMPPGNLQELLGHPGIVL